MSVRPWAGVVLRDEKAEARVRSYLSSWGPEMPPEAGDAVPLDFTAQCETFLELGPPVISSVMALFPPGFVRRLKERGVRWFATATTLAEALEAQRAGAIAIIAKGFEPGGHRGSFDDEAAELPRGSGDWDHVFRPFLPCRVPGSKRRPRAAQSTCAGPVLPSNGVYL